VKPKVSIVVPNYNHARFLKSRLDSILGQTLRDFEVICINDASTDSSLEVFASYASDPRVRMAHNAKNSGNVFKVWNKGIQIARGDYIWIAEADDCAEPTLLETLAKLLDDDERVGVAYCQSRIVNDAGEECYLNTRHTQDIDANRWMHDYRTAGTEECRKYLVIRNTIPNASAVVFRRSLYERIGGAPEDFKLSGDWMTWIKMLLISDVAFHARALNSFRQHGDTQRSKWTADATWIEERYRVLKFVLEQCNPDPTALEQARQLCFSALFEHIRYRKEVDQFRQSALLKMAKECDALFQGRWRRARATQSIRWCQEFMRRGRHRLANGLRRCFPVKTP